MAAQLRLLTIDLRGAVPAVREALQLSHAELDELVHTARSAGKHFDFALVSHPDCFEIYSTEASHMAAYRAVLFELVVRAGGRENLRALPTVEASGVAVARHLVRRAAGLDAPSVFEMLRELHAALTRARAAGTFGPELSALFGSAIEAGFRAYTDTALGDSSKSQAERDLDVLEAERIAEEELVAWQTAHGVVKSSPPPAFDVTYYSSAEPGSAIRLKSLVGLRSARVA